MSPLRDKRYLAELTGMSVDFWDDQCSKGRVPFTRFGRVIRFTDAQIEQIIAARAVAPKSVPTRDEVGARRARRSAA